VKFTHDGLSLWYGTPDAPAPVDSIEPRRGTSVVVGALPARPTNTVHVRYRVDRGLVHTAPGREVRTDHDRGVQYFVVDFPTFPTGHLVEYGPVLACGGRQVPGPQLAERFPSKFQLSSARAPAARAPEHRAGPTRPCSVPGLEFLANVGVEFERSQFVGDTPEGVRIDYFGKGGVVEGPRITGRLLPGSADHLFVRPDGVGMIRVRAVIETNDGAMLEVEYSGVLELGEDGYARACANNPPPYPKLVVCPRVLTGHPKYLWLNRLQCLGVGQVYLPEARLEFSLFGATAPPAAA
jgi:uncharacterized protein DUF3237